MAIRSAKHAYATITTRCSGQPVSSTTHMSDVHIGDRISQERIDSGQTHYRRLHPRYCHRPLPVGTETMGSSWQGIDRRSKVSPPSIGRSETAFGERGREVVMRLSLLEICCIIAVNSV